MNEQQHPQTILLNRFQFCHVIDRNTGNQTLHEGPKRVQLESHEEVGAIQDKVRVFDAEFVVVLNPFDSGKNDICEGEREVRIGPCVFSLRPGEKLEADAGGKFVRKEFVLTDDEALLLRAEKDVPNPLKPEETLVAGTEILLKGPRHFIPHKDIKIKEQRKSFSLGEKEGLYVQNDDSGVIRIVKGPTDFFLDANESFWEKELTDEEEQALGFAEQHLDESGDKETSRVLSATPRERINLFDAVVVELEYNEAICIYDNDKVRVEFGPQTIFFAPNERPKVLFISGGVPVRSNVLRLAKLSLGPDFIRDQLVVRTKDNATLTLEVTYRWRFEVDEDNAVKLFALKDFVGFSAQTISSIIREEAAKHSFEVFHSQAAELVKQAVFCKTDKKVFEENGLVIFGVDVESITPEDPEIKKKLADAIKTNVDIYTRRVQEEAQLESERRLIDGRVKNEEARKRLIELEIANERKQAVERAKIDSATTLEHSHAEAKAIRVKAAAEREAEEKRLQAIAKALDSDGGKLFIELERARVLKDTDKVVVPTDSQLRLFLNESEK